MDNTIVRLECPKCGTPVRALLKNRMNKFILFVCPKCHSNVIHSKRRTGVLSDAFLKRLAKKRGFSCCGRLGFDSCHTQKNPISYEDIIDLKILLETSKDVDEVIELI